MAELIIVKAKSFAFLWSLQTVYSTLQSGRYKSHHNVPAIEFVVHYSSVVE